VKPDRASYDDARADTTTDCDVAGSAVVFAYGPGSNDGIAVSGDCPRA
jgi:hypothetical protein